ncbi:MAG: hypothetical protein RLZZ618_1930 [Pseudomonadota bacterium]
MALEANDLLLFARVVEEGSFSRAGERLGLPKSTVSRRVAALEAELGEQLLLRTTRKLTVTDLGHSVLEHARQVSSEVEAASSLVQHRQAKPAGRLRVTMPDDMALGGLMADFMLRYPDVRLEIDVSPRRVDLIGENFDLAIRMGDLVDDASLSARKLAHFNVALFASPGYIAQHGEPRHPSELLQHQGLHITTPAREVKPWVLTRDGERWQGTPRAHAIANAPELLLRLARAGSGITSVPTHFARPFVESGELIPVLPEWELPGVPAWLVFPSRRLMPARTRVFIDALTDEFSPTRCALHKEELRVEREAHVAAAAHRERAARKPIITAA